jgi:DNA-binding response OmpR family regulator
MPVYSSSSSVSTAFVPEYPTRANILVVEDPFVGRFLKAILQKSRYEVSAIEAFPACERLRQRNIGVDLVITNRPEIFREFAATLPLLYIAASPDYLLASQFPHCLVLQKPFRNEELLDAVECLTGSVVT